MFVSPSQDVGISKKRGKKGTKVLFFQFVKKRKEKKKVPRMIKVPLMKSSRRNRGKMVHNGKPTRGAELRSEMLGQPKAESHASLLTFYHCYEICPFIFNTAKICKGWSLAVLLRTECRKQI